MDARDVFLSDLKATRGARAAELLDGAPTLINASADDGTSLLQQAAYLRADAAIEALRARGAHVDIFTAAALGDIAEVRNNLGKGALATDTSADGFTPLHLAAHFGRVDAAAVLHKAGADVNAQSTNALANTPLHAASAGGQTKLVETLLEWGAEVNTLDAQANTPLHVAGAAGIMPMIDALLARGADKAARSKDGKTPADLARERGHADAAARLTPS